jgi:hypothetical protein
MHSALAIGGGKVMALGHDHASAHGRVRYPTD